ncbi:TolC family protein [[Pseudomonas] boreopolis]|uniref:TolC family protein n=1 Tax=Xanthomonas boreopolis TaxID=86183 RepID=UPI003DA0BAE6
MRLRLAALAAFALAPAVRAQVPAPVQILTLDDAIARVAQVHPDLRLADGQRAVLDANLAIAGQRPPLALGATIENALGSGGYRGFDQAEATVTLAGVLERGGKLDARRALAQANIDALAPQREIARLDLLAETARRYLAVSAAERQREIADVDIAQRRRAVEAARQRLVAGASPESTLLTAEAALAEAELDRDRALQAAQAARQNLAALWNARDPGFARVAGDPMALPALQDFDVLRGLLDATPELARLAGETRIREASVRLARTEAVADLQWQAGARYLRGGGDVALLAGLSVPLGSATRAAPAIRAAEAGLALSSVERESLSLRLYSTLSAAHGEYGTAQLEVRRLGDEVIPRLARAEQAAERAWRAGAIGYLEWAQLQQQRVDANRRQLAAAVAAQSALIEIQRLTGQPLVAGQRSNVQEHRP